MLSDLSKIIQAVPGRPGFVPVSGWALAILLPAASSHAHSLRSAQEFLEMYPLSFSDS